MKKVLFVCHGNICRSPMAMFVLRQMAKDAGISHKLQIDSVATSREEIGCAVYPPGRRELNRHGIQCDGHRARQITQADLDSSDYVYYMDSRNAQYLRRLFPGQSKWQPFLDRDVADPWYSGDFTQTWQDITEGCRKILEELL